MLKYVENRVLVAAHRGVAGANIPCNTKESFGIALSQGADILEIDVAKSIDGKYFVFHPGMEKPHLGIDTPLAKMTAEEIAKLRYINVDDVPTPYGITPLDQMLEFLKDKAYINVDKYWLDIEGMTEVIRKCGVEDQVIVKIPDQVRCLEIMEKCAPDLAVMAVVGGKDTFCDIAREMNVNYIGTEVIFGTDDDEKVSDAYIEKMHKNGMLIYGNAIVYDSRSIISAGHTDDLALKGDPENGWGWFLDKKFDIIQTDWCLMLKNYINSRRK